MRAAVNCTRRTLADEMARRTGTPPKLSRQMVEDILRHICAALMSGEDVKIAGFGLFKLQSRGARAARNPRTMEPVNIEQHRAVTFRGSRQVRW